MQFRYLKVPTQKYPHTHLDDVISCLFILGSCVIIHGQVVHRSELNRSAESRHAYTFHVIETDQVQYSADNWLQPPENKPFPVLYTKF